MKGFFLKKTKIITIVIEFGLLSFTLFCSLEAFSKKDFLTPEKKCTPKKREIASQKILLRFSFLTHETNMKKEQPLLESKFNPQENRSKTNPWSLLSPENKSFNTEPLAPESVYFGKSLSSSFKDAPGYGPTPSILLRF